MSMMAVHSVLPDSVLPAGAVQVKFEMSAEPDYAPATFGTIPGSIPYQEPNPVRRTRRIAYAYADERMRRMAYGMGGMSAAPETALMSDEMGRHFQGHHVPGAYVGGRSGRYDWGLAGGYSAPEWILMDDEMKRHFQGHHQPNAYVGGRSGRYDAGMGMGHMAYMYEIASRKAKFYSRGFAGLRGGGLRGLGQTCDETGNCYDTNGNYIGYMDPSGSSPFYPADPSYSGPIPEIVVPGSTQGSTVGQVPTVQTASGPVFGPYPTAGVTTVQAGGAVKAPNGQVLQVPASNASQAQLNQFWAAVAVAGIDVAKLAIIQPGTAQAGNSIVRQNPGYPVAPIATNTQTGINANLSTGAAVAGSTVAILGLGLVALMVLSKRGH